PTAASYEPRAKRWRARTSCSAGSIAFLVSCGWLPKFRPASEKLAVQKDGSHSPSYKRYFLQDALMTDNSLTCKPGKSNFQENPFQTRFQEKFHGVSECVAARLGPYCGKDGRRKAAAGTQPMDRDCEGRPCRG